MIANMSIFYVSSLLLFNMAGAKPVSSLQSLKQLLDEEMNSPLAEWQEPTMEHKEAQENTHQWESDPRNGKDAALKWLLGDILYTSKRSWNRFKKGGLRSCFGVRLERIGSFSGLGC